MCISPRRRRSASIRIERSPSRTRRTAFARPMRRGWRWWPCPTASSRPRPTRLLSPPCASTRSIGLAPRRSHASLALESVGVGAPGPPEEVLRTPEEAVTVCTHLDQVRVTQLPEAVDGCEECLRSGDPWLHLRICLECGHVGCCDDSPNRHASAHSGSSSHPIIRSLEPGEVWSWCYVDEV